MIMAMKKVSLLFFFCQHCLYIKLDLVKGASVIDKTVL